MKKTIKLTEAQVFQIISNVIKKNSMEGNKLRETAFDNVKRTIFPDQKQKEQREWFINLLNTSKPVFIINFFDDEYLVVKIEDKKYAKIKLTEELWTNEDYFIIYMYNNIDVEETNDKINFPVRNKNISSEIGPIKMNNFSKLSKRADEEIKIYADYQTYRIFNKKINEIKKTINELKNPINEWYGYNGKSFEHHISGYNERDQIRFNDYYLYDWNYNEIAPMPRADFELDKDGDPIYDEDERPESKIIRAYGKKYEVNYYHDGMVISVYEIRE